MPGAGDLRDSLRRARLYGILDTGYIPPGAAIPIVGELLGGGVQVLQLRAKRETPEAIVRLAGEILPLTRAAGVPLILNDHPDLVATTGADGAHIGQDDLDPAAARALVGPGAILGLSTHSLIQARGAIAGPVDYIGFGPLFATPTKPDYPPIGTAEIAAVHGLAGDLPIFCIGGIKPDNLARVLASGARRVVIVSGLLQARDIASTCRRCRQMLDAIV